MSSEGSISTVADNHNRLHMTTNALSTSTDALTGSPSTLGPDIAISAPASTAERPSFRDGLKYGAAGGVAGAFAKSCTAPLARLTILYQVNSSCCSSQGVRRCCYAWAPADAPCMLLYPAGSRVQQRRSRAARGCSTTTSPQTCLHAGTVALVPDFAVGLHRSSIACNPQSSLKENIVCNVHGSMQQSEAVLALYRSACCGKPTMAPSYACTHIPPALSFTFLLHLDHLRFAATPSRLSNARGQQRCGRATWQPFCTDFPTPQ